MPARWSVVARLLGLACPLYLACTACTYPSYRDARGTPPAPAAAPVEQVPVPPAADPELANLPGIPLVRLQGDPYERGFRYGRTFREEWRRSVRELQGYAVDYVKDVVPVAGLARFAIDRYAAIVSRNYSRSLDTMPREARAYAQGIADGAGIPASQVQRNVALVMLSDASCSAFVAFGPATDDGRLLQMRNLDYGGAKLPASEGTVLLLHEPPRGQRWLSIGVVGLVGSISGINESGISISEIGSESHDKTQQGMPMPILLERVLESARTLDEAVAIVRAAPGTGGYNYMMGSARERRGVAVEKTARHTAVFEIGPGNYADNPYFWGFAGFDCRADTAADPAVRRVQACSGGPGSPVGRGAYENRYRAQVELFERWGRRLDIERAAELAAAVAPRSNLHSILYDFDRGRVYVRNKAWFRDGRESVSDEDGKRLRAAAQPPAVVDLTRLFRGLATQAGSLPAPAADGLPAPVVRKRP